MKHWIRKRPLRALCAPLLFAAACNSCPKSVDDGYLTKHAWSTCAGDGSGADEAWTFSLSSSTRTYTRVRSATTESGAYFYCPANGLLYLWPSSGSRYCVQPTPVCDVGRRLHLEAVPASECDATGNDCGNGGLGAVDSVVPSCLE